MFFRVEAMGDVIYIEAKDRKDAERQFRGNYGDDVPASLLKWSEINELPEGEGVIYNPPE